MKRFSFLAMSLALAAWAGVASADGWSPDSRASNLGSVVNTRHNLLATYSNLPPEGWPWGMKELIEGEGATKGRWNAYGEVCVFCHTPHGASQTAEAPLWNRNMKGTNYYWTYSMPTFSGQIAEVSYGQWQWDDRKARRMNPNSQICLSCHDGTLGMDAVLNMPGSGRYSALGEYVEDSYDAGGIQDFLDTWTNPNGLPSTHDAMVSCYGCHSPGNIGWPQDFYGFVIAPWVDGALELRDDHPVAIKLPDTNIYDFNQPTGSQGDMLFYDTNGDGRADNNEVRFYDYGSGPSVECTSCHDPHGVESAGPGSMLIPSFLRVNNNGSSLCQTCHDK